MFTSAISSNDVRAAGASRMDEIIGQLRNVPAEEMRAYLKQRHPGTLRVPIDGRTAAVVQPDSLRVLEKMRAVEILMALNAAVETQARPMVSTFTFSSQVESHGYGMEYLPSTTFKTQDDVKAFPQVKSVYQISEGGAIPFPLKNQEGYMKFMSEEGTHVAPIQGTYLDTNYMNLDRYALLPFNRPLATACAAMATFYWMKNGVVSPVTATEAGHKLLNFDHLLVHTWGTAHNVNAALLEQWIRSTPSPMSSGWASVTAAGTTFAHHLYATACTLWKNDSFPVEFVAIINRLLRPRIDKRAGQTVPFATVDQTGFTIVHAPLQLPKNLGGVALDLTKHEATLSQAYTGLTLGRTFRGENAGEKGVMSRVSYCGVGVHSTAAEIAYLHANISRWATKARSIVLVAEQAKSATKTQQLLHALLMLDYAGTVVVPNTIQNLTVMVPITGQKPLNIENKQYRFGDSKFVVLIEDTMSIVNGIAVGKSFVLTKGDVVYDMRQLVFKQAGNNQGAFYDYVGEAAAARLAVWKTWRAPVVGHAPLVPGLLSMDMCVTTGVELHNLIMWVGCGIDLSPQEDDWWYLVKTMDDIKEVAAASLVANVVRCVRTLVGADPRAVLNLLRYRTPRVSLRSFAKVNVHVTAYMDVEIGNILVSGPSQIREWAKDASPSMVARVMTTDQGFQALMGEGGTEDSPDSLDVAGALLGND